MQRLKFSFNNVYEREKNPDIAVSKLFLLGMKILYCIRQRKSKMTYLSQIECRPPKGRVPTSQRHSVDLSMAEYVLSQSQSQSLTDRLSASDSRSLGLSQAECQPPIGRVSTSHSQCVTLSQTNSRNILRRFSLTLPTIVLLGISLCQPIIFSHL